jgi:ArsR family transcriptional regulator, arsenate/arsenite/antimonite-responsive transcriptional repressor
LENDFSTTFKHYKNIFKALADEKRLQLLHLLADSKEESTCVCDLMDSMQMAQSKLSYHLKILLQANIIAQEKKGTWHYYSINNDVMNSILSEELCCLFRRPTIQKNTEVSCGCTE